ncbi:hypothetical protein AVEN_133670-1 [Araneus ventricosus]|uniref:YqaJ viral recombinase domain-containing protein n=1 Tax=Araneus ventricosus TaxID=182803 RepID=A0A4Y2B7L7_ARAVE|nr:hypothetical protein AVEN_133670-1 [Araneus ventricosus]
MTNAIVAKSAKESYGDNAIGYVQVKRDGDLCTVKGRIMPEHRVRKKAHSVVLVCNESEDVILSVKCAASQGGCKHAVAFLAWAHRRSEEPPVTSIKCYWKKSKLSSVGRTIKFIKASELGKKPSKELPQGNDTFLKEFVAESKLHRFPRCRKFKEDGVETSATDFYRYVSSQLSDETCHNISKETMDQADSSLWHELRYGRITASKVHVAIQCNTLESCLAESILGAKFKVTKAMKRDQLLEGKVIKKLQNKINKSLKPCGFLLSAQNPFFGASPDAISDYFIVEVKCPIQRAQ